MSCVIVHTRVTEDVSLPATNTFYSKRKRIQCYYFRLADFNYLSSKELSNQE